MNVVNLITDNGWATAAAFLTFIVLALSLHEWAHAAVATKFGDDTPRLMGRLTFDPRAHLDPIGALLFLIAGFGWGRPVIINPLRLRSRGAELAVALAGPAVNLLAALMLNLIVLALSWLPASAWLTNLAALLLIGSQVNVMLAAFNFLPLPPLDGSSIITYFWPPYRSLFAGQFSILLLLALLFLPATSNLLFGLLNPVLSLFHTLALGFLIG